MRPSMCTCAVCIWMVSYTIWGSVPICYMCIVCRYLWMLFVCCMGMGVYDLCLDFMCALCVRCIMWLCPYATCVLCVDGMDVICALYMIIPVMCALCVVYICVACAWMFYVHCVLFHIGISYALCHMCIVCDVCMHMDVHGCLCSVYMYMCGTCMHGCTKWSMAQQDDQERPSIVAGGWEHF